MSDQSITNLPAKLARSVLLKKIFYLPPLPLLKALSGFDIPHNTGREEITNS